MNQALSRTWFYLMGFGPYGDILIQKKTVKAFEECHKRSCCAFLWNFNSYSSVTKVQPGPPQTIKMEGFAIMTSRR